MKGNIFFLILFLSSYRWTQATRVTHSVHFYLTFQMSLQRTLFIQHKCLFSFLSLQRKLLPSNDLFKLVFVLPVPDELFLRENRPSRGIQTSAIVSNSE